MRYFEMNRKIGLYTSPCSVMVTFVALPCGSIAWAHAPPYGRSSSTMRVTNRVGGTSSSTSIVIFPDLESSSTRWCPSLESVDRSEEHTSELQSPCNLVCRLLLEK